MFNFLNQHFNAQKHSDQNKAISKSHAINATNSYIANKSSNKG